MNAPQPTEDYKLPLPAGWTGGKSTTKWWRNKIIHLYRLHRPCAQCGVEMRIDVTRAALDGTAKNAGLHLKRCPDCRAKLKGADTSSRPAVEGIQPGVFSNGGDEIEMLRTANATMKEELAGVYAQNKELRERLLRYEPELKMPWK